MASFLDNIRDCLHYCFAGLRGRIGEHHVFLLAGGMSFSIFVCVIPLGLIIFSVLGVILNVSNIEEQVKSLIDAIIPYPDYADYVSKVIVSRIDEVISHKKLAGYLGVAGLLIAASTLFSSMRTILNTVYGERSGKSLVVAKLRDLGMVVLVLVFFLLSITILPTLVIVEEFSFGVEYLKVFQFNALQQALVFAFSFFLIFLMFFIVYYLIPYEPLGVRVVAVSAFWAALLWELAKEAFGYYITNIAVFGHIYGTYVMIVVVAFWIYYSSAVFVLGAEIGQLYREWREGSENMRVNHVP